jgi:hypothetical protein
MTLEQYQALMLENAVYQLNQLDKLIGTISSMKGNAKFDQIKQNCKIQRKHLVLLKELFTND